MNQFVIAFLDLPVIDPGQRLALVQSRTENRRAANKNSHESFAVKLFMLSAICAFAGNLADFAPASGNSEKKPVSRLSQYWQENGKTYNLALEQGSAFEKITESELKFKIGTFLIESQGEIYLQLPSAVLHMRPRSMALVRVKPGIERVFCLLASATVKSQQRSIPVACGEEVLISDHMFKPLDITGEYHVGVRGLRVYDLDDNCRIASMEFSILQAMENEPLLNQITHSKHSHDRILKDKLLKSVAVLKYVTNRHGPYIPYSGE